MKTLSFLTPIVLVLLASSASAGTFVSGSTGADGAFNPTTNTQLQLPPSGLFNFTTVNIPAGVTVTFKKNAANTPVYLLATGDVTISGSISVDGETSLTNLSGTGGPGGFDGGNGGIAGFSNGTGGKGLGPGGGDGGPVNNTGHISGNYGGGGGYGSIGYAVGPPYGAAAGGSSYGNARIIPLIGGSGGGGSGGPSGILGLGGGGGGGAILIASSGAITIGGSITTNGGGLLDYYLYNTSCVSGGGSGGAVKLMANKIAGNGVLQAKGSPCWGGMGRIRIESYTNNFASTTDPAYSYGLPGSIFIANTPNLQVSSIGGVNIPSNPTASFMTPDIALPNTTTNPVTVTLSASNIPIGTTVTISVIPQYGAAASVTTTLSGIDAASTGTASVNLSTSFASVIMAWTTYTLQTAMYWEGEKIDKVRVAASMGKDSKAVYITASGKEIPAEMILAGLMK